MKLGNRGCTVFDFDFGLRHTGPARISRQDSTCIYSIMEQGNPLTVLPFGKPFLLTSTGSRARRIHLYPGFRQKATVLTLFVDQSIRNSKERLLQEETWLRKSRLQGCTETKILKINGVRNRSF